MHLHKSYNLSLPLEFIALARARMRSSSAAFARAIATEFVEATDPNDETEPEGDRPEIFTYFSNKTQHRIKVKLQFLTPVLLTWEKYGGCRLSRRREVTRDNSFKYVK